MKVVWEVTDTTVGVISGLWKIISPPTLVFSSPSPPLSLSPSSPFLASSVCVAPPPVAPLRSSSRRAPLLLPAPPPRLASCRGVFFLLGGFLARVRRRVSPIPPPRLAAAAAEMEKSGLSGLGGGGGGCGSRRGGRLLFSMLGHSPLSSRRPCNLLSQRTTRELR